MQRRKRLNYEYYSGNYLWDYSRDWRVLTDIKYGAFGTGSMALRMEGSRSGI
jgi:hypothetical protein